MGKIKSIILLQNSINFHSKLIIHIHFTHINFSIVLNNYHPLFIPKFTQKTVENHPHHQ